MSERMRELVSGAGLCLALLLIPTGTVVMGASVGLGVLIVGLGVVCLAVDRCLDK